PQPTPVAIPSPPGLGAARAGRMRSRTAGAATPERGGVVEVTFPGADEAVAPAGEGRLPGSASDFLGDDPSRWRTNVPTFGAVRYPDRYPWIDLRYHGPSGQLESE